jgi:hypothetical protein
MRNLEKPNWKKQQERKSRLWLLGLILVLLVPIGAVSAYVLKNALANSFNFGGSGIETKGSVIKVSAGGDFQAALDKAKPGDTILLEAGADFVGNFKLPNKSGNEFITIRTSAEDKELPPEYTRIDPKKYAEKLPKIFSETPDPVISAMNSAHHYRFFAVEFGGTKDGNGNIIKIGSSEEKSIEELPHHIEFDRIYLHATSPLGQRRGIAANGKYIKIINSYFEGIRRKGEESQAIAAWSTDGPIEIVNNYLEAAAENILFGGSGSPLELTPTDCLIRDNHLNKPLEWQKDDWIVKNIFEIKHGRRFKVENNLMTNNWAMAQDGTGVVIKTSPDSGENVVVEDITFINNIVRGTGSGVSINGGEGKGGHNLTIRNNYFIDLGVKEFKGDGFFMKSASWDGLTIENNTIINTGQIAKAYGDPIKNFVFRNNIVFENDYGFKGDGTAAGQATLSKYFSNGKVENNIIVGGDASSYRGNNFFLSSINQIGFTGDGNYLLQGNSPYLKKGSDGKQIGASLNIERVGKSNP